MTTPLISPSRKHTHHPKPLIDETLSPVKINLKPIEPPIHPVPQVDDAALIQHPHGLHAKHEAKRNTVGHKRRSLVNTPLVDVQARRRNPMTSPSVNQGVINLESIKRSKLLLDSQFEKLGKENKQPKHLDDDEIASEADSLSSPIKRPSKHKDEPLRKIARLNEPAEKVIEDDDVILDDLVERFSQPPTTTQETSSPLVIDSSDNEEEPKPVKHSHDHTLVNKIIQDNSHIDYVTPQRYTEPIAKSPGANQIARINEDLDLKAEENDIDGTSPLKKKQVDEKPLEYDDETIHRLDNEPTINFLMSPNSKPVFSIDQMNKIQQENSKRTKGLLQDISTRDQTIQLLNDQLNQFQRDLITHQHDLRDLKKINGELESKEQILSIQLKHNERELASLTKSFKIKETVVEKLSQELREKSDKLVDMESQITELNNKVEELHDVKDELIEMSDLNEKYVNQIDSLIKEKNIVQDQNEELRNKLENDYKKEEYEQLEQANEELNKENVELRNEFDKLNSELERANKEKEELRSHIIDLHTEIDQLKNVNEQLTVDKEKLTAANQENERLIKEYDNVAHERISDLENELEEMRRNSQREKENLSLQLEEMKKNTQQEKQDLTSQLEEAAKLNKELEAKVEHLESETTILKEEITHLETLNNKKSIALEEKEQTISDDMVKLNELVQAVTESRKQNSQDMEELNKQIDTLTRDNTYLTKEIQKLQDKLETSQAEADKEFDNLAQYLHHEYSEKHAKKLGEVKIHFEEERDSLIRDKKAAEREVELLKRKVNQMTKEFNQMSEILKSNKLSVSRRSPIK